MLVFGIVSVVVLCAVALAATFFGIIFAAEDRVGWGVLLIFVGLAVAATNGFITSSLYYHYGVDEPEVNCPVVNCPVREPA